MVTVIATGFDGGKKIRSATQRESTGVMDTSGSNRASHERDFLEELQRQRQEVTDGGSPFTSPEREDETAAVVSAPRVERSVGEVPPARRQTTYDADDLEIPSFLRRK